MTKEVFVFPASLAQQRLWFVDQLEPGSTLYNVTQAFRITGSLSAKALHQAFEALVARHESLRTTFTTLNDNPVQVIAETGSALMPEVDLSDLPQAAHEQEVQRLILEETLYHFDLVHGPLMRTTLLRVNSEEHVLLLTNHHIISDGWSWGVFLRELGALYSTCAAGKPSPLEPLSIQYADYAVWQRQWLESEQLKAQLSYWERQLAGAPSMLELPIDYERPPIQGQRGACHFTVLPKGLSDELNALSRREGVTLFMTILAAFETLLARYTGQHDIVVGTDVANRNRVEIEGLIGFFLNHLVLRTDLSGDPTFRELLQRVREVALEAYAHQEVPFDKVVGVLKPERSRSYTPLFQVLFVLQNVPMQTFKLAGLSVTPLVFDSGTAKFDLALFMEETERGLEAVWVYRTDLFKSASIARMAARFETLLGNIVAQPESRLSALEMISEAERIKKTMEAKEREEAHIKKLRSIQRKAVDLAQVSSTKSDVLISGKTQPLVIEPALEDVNLKEWASINRGEIQTKLLRHGAILFRGFSVSSVSEFEDFALAICPELFGEYGDLPREGVSGKVYGSTPYPHDQTILFHNESSHMHRWPMKIWFYCVQAAKQGGETPIADIRRVFQLLDPRISARFKQKKLMYVRNYIDGLDVSWQTFFGTSDKTAVENSCRKISLDFEWKDDGGLRTRQLCHAVVKHPQTGEEVFFNQIQLHHISCLEPALRESLLSTFREEDLPRNVYYGDGSKIEDSIVQEIREIYQTVQVSFPWKEGDILMLNNMLTAHARNPFVGPRKIVVAMGEMTNQKDLRD